MSRGMSRGMSRVMSRAMSSALVLSPHSSRCQPTIHKSPPRVRGTCQSHELIRVSDGPKAGVASGARSAASPAGPTSSGASRSSASRSRIAIEVTRRA